MGIFGKSKICCIFLLGVTRPGKRLHNYGKSPCLMGKLTISMAIFNSYVNVYQRVTYHFHAANRIPTLYPKCQDSSIEFDCSSQCYPTFSKIHRQQSCPTHPNSNVFYFRSHEYSLTTANNYDLFLYSTIFIWVNYNDLTVLPHWKSWLVYGTSSPHGRKIQVSEIL